MTVRVFHGDCREILRTLPDQSVHCVVTSPPYYKLRDYGVDGQMGLEDTPEQFVAEMVEVFREVRRVLRDDGTLFLNIGDSYASGGNGVGNGKQLTNVGSWLPPKKPPHGLKPKDLIGIPWMLAFALRADGWYLRSEIIWHKPNPMPESVTDRPTKSHEQIFLLTKSPRYYYDAEAIKEAGTVAAGTKGAKGSAHRAATPGVNSRPPEYKIYDGTRNARSVWTIATKPFAEAHFATFPPDLPERCIKAGTSERGCCAACGAPWGRVTERVAPEWDGSRYGERAVAASGGAKTGGTAKSTLGSPNGTLTGQSATVGWQSSCGCVIDCPSCEGGGLGAVAYAPNAPGGLAETCCTLCDGKGVVAASVIPCTVLDPFGGAGTTGLVADRLQRHAILIELNPQYAEMARRRIADDAGLLGVA